MTLDRDLTIGEWNQAKLAAFIRNVVTGEPVTSLALEELEVANLSVTGTFQGSGVSITGMVFAYAGAAAPGGFLLCDGSTVARSSYSDLFNVIGHTYGADPGNGNFILPDLRGRMPVGLNSSNSFVNALGDNEGVTLANRSPNHSHDVTAGIGSGGAMQPSMTADYDPGLVNTSGNSALRDMPAFLTINYIIKA